MKILLLFPLAYMAGVYGFDMLAPYIVVVLLMAFLSRVLTKPRQKATSPISTDEPAARP